LARIYEECDNGAESPGEPNRDEQPDSTTRQAALRFWLYGALAVISGIICLLAFMFLPGTVLPVTLGSIAAAATVFTLLAMRRAVRAMHFASPAQIEVSDSVEDWLEQLDDRFAVFRGIHAGDSFVDLLIVGPSGTFTVKASPVAATGGMPDRGQVRASARERDDVRQLLSTLVPGIDPPTVDAVICLPPGHTPVVEQEENGVWVVAARQIVPALLKRSGRDGAITRGVNQTGAFSADAVERLRIEKALAAHYHMQVRKTLADYTAPVPGKPRNS
jgi:hypothetical protein